MSSIEPCRQCQEALMEPESTRSAPHLRFIRESEFAYTTYTYLECPYCDSKWQAIQDHDEGMKGSFLKMLDTRS